MSTKEEEMEVEFFYEEKPFTNSHPKRNASDNNKINDSVSIPWTNFSANLKSNSNQTERKILKVKRTPYDVHLILDTNVLVENLNTLKDLIVNCDNKNQKSKLRVNVARIIVPWTVINELDGLKESTRNTRRKTMDAIRFIQEQIKYGTENFVCLDQKDQLELSSEISNEHHLLNGNNDDRILQCCLMLSMKEKRKSQNPTGIFYSSSSSPVPITPKFILITNDLNLQNKALIHKIESLSLKEFLCKYSNSSTNKNYEFRTTPKLATNQNSHQSTSDLDCNPKNKRLKTSEEDMVCSSDILTLTSPTWLSSEIIQIHQEDNNNPKPNFKSGSNVNLNSKYTLESRLSKFMVEKCQEQFQDSKFQDILGKDFDPENVSLLNLLRIFKRNWIGLYGDYFNRDKNMFNLIQEMLMSERNRNSENCEKFIKLLDGAKRPWLPMMSSETNSPKNKRTI